MLIETMIVEAVILICVAVGVTISLVGIIVNLFEEDV